MLRTTITPIRILPAPAIPERQPLGGAPFDPGLPGTGSRNAHRRDSGSTYFRPSNPETNATTYPKIRRYSLGIEFDSGARP